MNAPRDDNHIPVKLGVWCVDGTTTIPIAVNPVNGGVKTDITSTISYTPTQVDPQDANFVNVLLAQDGNGHFYPVNVNSDGAILIEN